MISRRKFLGSAALLTGTVVLPISSAKVLDNFKNESQNLTGYTTVKGKVKLGSKALKNAVVSDGYSVVQTNELGEFNFITNKRFVFLSIPSGYKIPISNFSTAKHYYEMDYSKTVNEINFDLQKTNDDEHTLIVFADPQTLDDEDMKELQNETIPDLKKTVKEINPNDVFGVSVGDIMFNHLELYPKYQDAVKESGVPFFQVLGNHDVITSTKTDEASEVTFEDFFGPRYYSFNRGKVHYVVLDNIFWYGTYIGYISQDQLDWLKKDLAFVPKDHKVVLFMHIPPITTQYKRYEKDKPSDRVSVVNRKLLYDIIKDYNSLIISGHTHESEYIKDEDIDIHICGAVCGAWWTGPICHDGTPKGYMIYHAKGNELKRIYKSTGYDLDHQFSIYKPHSEFNETDELIINVWGYDSSWKVEVFADGKSLGNPENRLANDPQAVILQKGNELPKKHTWVEPLLNNHMFFITPPKNANELIVKVTDGNGVSYERSV